MRSLPFHSYRRIREFVGIPHSRPSTRAGLVQKRNRAENIGELSDIGKVTDVFENFIPLLHSTISPGAVAARTCPFHRRCSQVSPSFDACCRKCAKQIEDGIHKVEGKEKVTFPTCCRKFFLSQLSTGAILVDRFDNLLNIEN